MSDWFDNLINTAPTDTGGSVPSTPIEQFKIAEANLGDSVDTTTPEATYSNEGRNYPTVESTQGSGGSPVNATAPGGFDLRGLTDAFKGLFGQAGSAMSTPAGFLTGLAALYALAGGNKATPTSQGYRGSIPKLTATRAPAVMPAPRAYGAPAMGDRKSTRLNSSHT